MDHNRFLPARILMPGTAERSCSFGGDTSNPPDRRDLEIAALRERLSRLGQASLRITQDLDFNPVPQGTPDYPRSFTGARLGGNIPSHTTRGL